MRTAFFIVLCILTTVVFQACDIERRYQKERIENGNDLSFTYFKQETKTLSSWYGYFPQNGIDSLQVIYFGGQTEVSNKSYWAFLDYLKQMDSISLFEKHKPKTDNWLNFVDDFNFADSMFNYYDDLELFGNYPVVNITPEDVQEYVNWLNGIEPDSTVVYTIFTAQDWQLFFNKDHTVDSSFAWGSNFWMNSSRELLGNFAEFDQNQIRYNQLTDKISWEDSDSIGYKSYVNGPMECWSFSPNYWGAYNMSGNVAEITNNYLEVDGSWYCKTRGGSWHSPVFYLREIAEESYLLPSPYVGFRVVKIQFRRVEEVQNP